MTRIYFASLLLLICFCKSYGQTYTPVPITGYAIDAVAESGTSSAAVTTIGLDLQLKVLYSATFAATNNIAAGLPDNGTIVNGQRTYQLKNYDSLNAIFLSANAAAAGTTTTGTYTLLTPAAYSKISLLAWSTERSSTFNVTLHFVNAPDVNAGTFTVADWFGGNNPMINAIGRILRTTSAPYTVEGLSSNDPRMYAVDIPVPCNVQSQLLSSVTFDYIIGGGGDSRAVIAAISAVPFAPIAATATTVPATCGYANGSITVSVSGGTAPLTLAWNTNPVQFTNTATNLAAGAYTVSILDGNGCITNFDTTLSQNSPVQIAAKARPAAICAGASTTIYAVPTGGQIIKYTWEPGAIPDSSTLITPASSTQYTVTAEDAFGCIIKDSVKITVNSQPGAPAATAPAVCPDSTATLLVTNPVDSLTYNWYPLISGGENLGSGKSYTTPGITTPTSYFVEAVNGSCVSGRTQVTVTPFEKVDTPHIKAGNTSGSTITFTWDPVPGATGYLVSVNGAAYTTPSSGTTGTTHVVNAQMIDSVTLTVVALGPLACENNKNSITVKLKADPIYVPNAFTPNGDGLNDIFKAEGNTIAAIDMMVFNQWGELIFHSMTLGSGWDGTYNGKKQPTGVYMYTIRVIQNDQTIITKKGSINLLR
ncbi:gliding motility-associated C-terminal domain-containing protein [Chitinophaga sancti]|uniref:Gliding motility-associated C-terminal domain-containing protein n=1 Tax=Chitinophaga sancti TaxID=1004 RepID=A0A1K1S6Z9_9BACT|nr:gliding motility-associated C-terminal domain-containing protein [Chitinophaga sancti]WQD62168.1 gliding motility-associated C-terminal domain-containing protein [Chitinophaga sancti]WQG92263.1 gliding motility-associated C-terminal domain-containing protein [Chitinophaga sancti]SFW80137.1 gliding motility-associated C-terminal domain-containing protein [Chitinophaga sancti]